MMLSGHLTHTGLGDFGSTLNLCTVYCVFIFQLVICGFLASQFTPLHTPFNLHPLSYLTIELTN